MREWRIGNRATFASRLLVLVALLPSTAMAQQVYKCSDGKSAAVYQQVPCAEPTQEQAVREYAREPARPEAADAPVPPAGESDWRYVEEPTALVTKPPRAAPPRDLAREKRVRESDEKVREAAHRQTSCGIAQEEQKKLLARVGRSVSKMRAAEAAVSRTCR